jgi:ribulose-phosphate 3-epimerase
MILAPSMLSADFKNLGEEINAVEKGGAEFLHIDVMDGIFVPCISFGMPVIKSIRSATDMVFDVHLMIVDPIRYIKEFASSGADLITFHLEAAEDPQAVIDEIRSHGCKVGISIKPKTPFEEVIPYMDKVDMLLIMTVEPGFGGQKMMPETIGKVRAARDYVTEKGLTTDIQVDGGVKYDNINIPLEAGANIFVAGSAVFGADTFGETKRFVEYLANR